MLASRAERRGSNVHVHHRSCKEILAFVCILAKRGLPYPIGGIWEGCAGAWGGEGRTSSLNLLRAVGTIVIHPSNRRWGSIKISNLQWPMGVVSIKFLTVDWFSVSGSASEFIKDRFRGCSLHYDKIRLTYAKSNPRRDALQCGCTTLSLLFHRFSVLSSSPCLIINSHD